MCLAVLEPQSILGCCVQVDKCFGFDTAVEEAQHALLAAKIEARSGYRGLGLVKLMGRHSGFITMQASMASGVFNQAQQERLVWALCSYSEQCLWHVLVMLGCSAWIHGPSAALNRACTPRVCMLLTHTLHAVQVWWTCA